MDKNFLEFWNNYLKNAVAGRSQLDEMTRWMQHGFSGSDNLTAMFKRAYGLDKFSEDLPDYTKLAGEAALSFQNSLKGVLSSMGMVPGEEHAAILEENEALKKKLAELEKAIAQLKTMLDENMTSSDGRTKNFQDMLTSQNEQFQTLMNSIGQFLKPE